MAKRVYFVDGHLARDDLFGAAAYLHELAQDDVEFTRFYTHNLAKNQWWHLELPHEIVSLTFTPDRTWHLLSKRGKLIQISATVRRELAIDLADTGPGKHGYVKQVRLIAGQLYVCGFGRQVYRLDGDIFTLISGEILAGSNNIDFGFESIDGTSSDNIYAVGRKGEIFHFNGRGWTSISTITNCDLNRVRCASRDSVYVCGDSGTFLRGGQGAWSDLSDPDFREHFWGLEIFQERPYLAHLRGLRMFNGTAIVPVTTGLSPEIDGYRLHAGREALWSFGNDDIAVFDGKSWKRVVCPDNS